MTNILCEIPDETWHHSQIGNEVRIEGKVDSYRVLLVQSCNDSLCNSDWSETRHKEPI